MKAITLEQKMTASKEYGVKLSTRCTERSAAKACKNATKKTFKGEIVWSSKI